MAVVRLLLDVLINHMFASNVVRVICNYCAATLAISALVPVDVEARKLQPMPLDFLITEVPHELRGALGNYKFIINVTENRPNDGAGVGVLPAYRQLKNKLWEAACLTSA
jgi:hypothetical protein